MKTADNSIENWEAKIKIQELISIYAHSVQSYTVNE